MPRNALGTNEPHDSCCLLFAFIDTQVNSLSIDSVNHNLLQQVMSLKAVCVQTA
jgi:hypothetical protein